MHRPAGGTAYGSGVIPTDDDGDAEEAGLPNAETGSEPGGPGGSRFGGCEAYFAAVQNCYEGESGGYGTGGDDENGGISLGDYCAEYLGLLSEAYGAACAAAFDESFACLAQFACQDLGEGGAAELCSSKAEAVASACAGLTPNCGDGDLDSDGEVCSLTLDGCADGQTYGLECGAPDSETEQSTCSCIRSGNEVLSFEEERACQGDLSSLLADNCGFPV